MHNRSAADSIMSLERTLMHAEQWLDSVRSVSIGIQLQQESLQIRHALTRVRHRLNRLAKRTRQLSLDPEVDSSTDRICQRASAAITGSLPRSRDRLIERMALFLRTLDQAIANIIESYPPDPIQAALANCRLAIARLVHPTPSPMPDRAAAAASPPDSSNRL